MENLTALAMTYGHVPLKTKLHLLKSNFYYKFDDVKDYKENARKMRKNPIVSLFSTGYAARESHYRNGAIVIMSPLWGNTTRVNENFLKLNVRDNSGELELDVFDSTKLKEGNIEISKGFLDAIKHPEWDYRLFKSWSEKSEAHEKAIFGNRKPIRYCGDIVEFEKQFRGINNLIGSMYAFYSFDDKGLYLIDTDGSRIPKRKEEAFNLLSLFDLSVSPALS